MYSPRKQHNFWTTGRSVKEFHYSRKLPWIGPTEWLMAREMPLEIELFERRGPLKAHGNRMARQRCRSSRGSKRKSLIFTDKRLLFLFHGRFMPRYVAVLISTAVEEKRANKEFRKREVLVASKQKGGQIIPVARKFERGKFINFPANTRREWRCAQAWELIRV